MRVAGTRWTIEECFKPRERWVKYEVRKWDGWYRHDAGPRLGGGQAPGVGTRRSESPNEKLIRRCPRSAVALPWETSTYGPAAVVPVETAAPGNGPALPLPTPPETPHHISATVVLRWKAWQRGALVLDVNEAYTSKTRSWDGAVNTKLGGAKAIRDENGFGMDRDVNGARGIFLRALGDSPFLRGLLTQVASQTTASA